MEEGKTPGNAMSSPFGDSKGATQAAGPSSGAHNFLEDPASHAPATGGRDFSKESRPQQMGYPEDRYCPYSPPEGGDMPFEQIDKASQASRDEMTGQLAEEPKHKPFKLSGEG
jgi:hypothetical protein